jgi:hypothetical protein
MLPHLWCLTLPWMHDTSAGPTPICASLRTCCRYPDFQHRFYPHLKHLEDEGAYCQYKDPLLALFVSSLFLAGLFGGEAASWQDC